MATLQEQLAEAQAAYHDLMIGRAAVRFRDQSGEDVTYTAPDAARLEAYIAKLQAQIAAAASGCTAPIGPLRVTF